MFICADIPPLAKTQSTQRNGLGGGGAAAAQNRMRTARNHGYDTTATNRFFYNAQNKLVRIEGRGFTNEFAYDSQNRRIGVKLSGTWRYDAHDGNLCIGSVVNGLLDRFFVRGAGIAEGTGDIIAEIPDPRNPSPHPYYYISNHRGDTLAVLDYLYNTAARYEYDAYGNVIEKTGTYTPRYTFSTKEYLSSAALYLYQYRVYDPTAGRWTQRDPIDYQDSINLYQFCGNNPVNATDPDGRALTLGLATLVGTALGAVSAGAVSYAKGQSWDQIKVSAFKGAVMGAAIGLTIETCGAAGLAVPAAMGWIAGVGAAVGGTLEGSQAALEGRSSTEIGVCTLVGAAGGASGAVLGGQVANPVASAAVSAITSGALETLGIDTTKGVVDKYKEEKSNEENERIRSARRQQRGF